MALARPYYCAWGFTILASIVMPLRQPRRSKRLVLSVPVHVLGQDVFREPFNEFTRILSLSAHGGSLALAAQVETGQTILVVNRNTGQEQECRVAHIGPLKDGKWAIGIEFTEPAEDFWRIHFPTCTARQPSTAPVAGYHEAKAEVPVRGTGTTQTRG
jgi:uncharacterized DUF497 family protein